MQQPTFCALYDARLNDRNGNCATTPLRFLSRYDERYSVALSWCKVFGMMAPDTTSEEAIARHEVIVKRAGLEAIAPPLLGVAFAVWRGTLKHQSYAVFLDGTYWGRSDTGLYKIPRRFVVQDYEVALCRPL